MGALVIALLQKLSQPYMGKVYIVKNLFLLSLGLLASNCAAMNNDNLNQYLASNAKVIAQAHEETRQRMAGQYAVLIARPIPGLLIDTLALDHNLKEAGLGAAARASEIRNATMHNDSLRYK